MRSVITSATPMAVVRRSRVSRLTLLGLVLAMTTLAACSGKSSGGIGSSGGSDGNPSPASLSGDTAVKAVVVSGYQAFQGGLSYPLLQVEATLPASSPLKPAVVAVVDRMVGRESSPATSMKAATRAAATAPALTYDSTLGLYEAGFTISDAILTDQFYSDAAGTQSAGTLTITYPAGTTITSLGEASATPPYTMTITANITAGNLPMSGSGTIALRDSLGAGEIQGTFTLTQTKVSVTADLTLADDGNVTGTATITENGQTLSVTDLSGPFTANIQGSVAVAPQGYTGTVTVSIANGTFTLDLTTPSGNATGSLTSSGLVINYADGTGQVVGSPLTTAPGTAAAPVADTASIAGTVYTNSNNSGTFAAGDPELAGVTVTLTGPSGTLTTTTNSSGGYSFTDLIAGAYSVSSPATASSETLETASLIKVTLTAGQTATSDNFGYVVGSGPVTAMYTIGGTVSGLAGGGTLSLQNDGGNTLTVSANGIFTFAAGSATGAAYAVTISAQPSGQACTVSGGSGTVGTADIGNIAVSCAAAAVAISEWTWVSGSDTANALGSYGTKGVAAAGNVPGARISAGSWTDAAGNLWLLGGGDQTGQYVFNDLWKYNPASKLWTWVSGSSNNPEGVYGNQLGVYGTRGVAAATNVPGARKSANTWIDSTGNLWLFGGEGWDSQGNFEILNDLWKFAPSSGLWTWVGGSNVVNAAGVYGTQGVSAAGNVPGARQLASSWTDASGNFWLFGGSSFDAPTGGNLNDLWTYNPSSGQWTWVSGSNGIGAAGVYGTPGIASAGNVPSARYQASSWIDPAGNFWIFGGVNGVGVGNDLWKYNPGTKLWAWVSGSDTGYAASIFGTQGQAAAGNVPGARSSASSWTDAAGNLWLLGGAAYSSDGEDAGALNDFWEFSPSTGEWTWIGGSQTSGAAGSYGTEGTASAGNMPGARIGASSWTDGAGNFWLFGGGYSNVYNDLWNYVPAQ
jgi:hypothetical protein